MAQYLLVIFNNDKINIMNLGGTMKSSFKLRLFRWLIFVSVIPAILIGAFSYFMIFKEIQEDTERLITSVNDGIYNMIDTQQRVLNQWLLSAADSFEKKMEDLGPDRFDYNEMLQVGDYYLPTWYMGDQKITYDYSLVDELIETERLPASIFMLIDNEFVRVSTNVRQKNGERITATTLDKEGPIYDRLINGQTYLGRANVEGIMHATIYAPIFDETEKTLIGAFVLGRKEQEYELIKNIEMISIGEDGYVMILDSNGDVIIHPEMTGQNVIEYDWIKKIISKKDGYIEYNYENEAKIAYYKYFEPWDWYIVSIGVERDIYSTSNTLSIMLVFVIALSFGISVLIARRTSSEFFKPIDKLMESLRRLKNGDLSSRFSSYEDEEFKFLSNTFNSMSYTLSLLIGRIIGTSNKLNAASERLLDDFNRSKKALENIEKTVEAFLSEINSYKSYEENIITLNSSHEIKTELESIKEVLLDTSDLNEIKAESLLESIDGIEEKINSINCFFSNFETSRKLNGLFIEIQKLKLLLENINGSASSLDDIANEVDSQANLFKIDKDPYQE